MPRSLVLRGRNWRRSSEQIAVSQANRWRARTHEARQGQPSTHCLGFRAVQLAFDVHLQMLVRNGSAQLSPVDLHRLRTMSSRQHGLLKGQNDVCQAVRLASVEHGELHRIAVHLERRRIICATKVRTSQLNREELLLRANGWRPHSHNPGRRQGQLRDGLYHALWIHKAWLHSVSSRESHFIIMLYRNVTETCFTNLGPPKANVGAVPRSAAGDFEPQLYEGQAISPTVVEDCECLWYSLSARDLDAVVA
mmetsp:Transcript_100212/g.180848  ORF Transcript_100212/g.180848 Transcript_100212/m.180848 type:complete len:251 (+) Transcript_100212:779-1531(+)